MGFHPQDVPSRVALCELNGISLLLGQLRSEFPVIQELVLRTLERITADKEARVAFREEQGLEKLLEFLTTKVITQATLTRRTSQVDLSYTQ